MTNGHAPDMGAPIEDASEADLDALLRGSFEPVPFEIAPGRMVEIRPLMLGHADALYAGGLSGAALQRFLMAHCVHINGRPLGMAGAARVPIILANRLVPAVMAANGMEADLVEDDEEKEAGKSVVDPKA